VSPEELRRAALDALGEHADERARDVLRRASIAIDSAFRWASALGWDKRRNGVRVTLAVDAATLGMLRAAPAVADALNVAVAGAVATEREAKLVDFAARWLPAAPPSAAAYRDAPPEAPETAFREALLAYLGGAGDHALAAALANAEVDASDPTDVTVRSPRPEHDALRADAYAVARLTSAVRDLLGRPDAHVRLRTR
jgi:hypothetical protein